MVLSGTQSNREDEQKPGAPHPEHGLEAVSTATVSVEVRTGLKLKLVEQTEASDRGPRCLLPSGARRV